MLDAYWARVDKLDPMVGRKLEDAVTLCQKPKEIFEHSPQRDSVPGQDSGQCPPGEFPVLVFTNPEDYEAS